MGSGQWAVNKRKPSVPSCELKALFCLAAFGLLLFCTLHTAHCSLPTAHCPLPTAHCYHGVPKSERNA